MLNITTRKSSKKMKKSGVIDLNDHDHAELRKMYMYNFEGVAPAEILDAINKQANEIHKFVMARIGDGKHVLIGKSNILLKPYPYYSMGGMPPHYIEPFSEKMDEIPPEFSIKIRGVPPYYISALEKLFIESGINPCYAIYDGQVHRFISAKEQ